MYSSQLFFLFFCFFSYSCFVLLLLYYPFTYFRTLTFGLFLLSHTFTYTDGTDDASRDETNPRQLVFIKLLHNDDSK